MTELSYGHDQIQRIKTAVLVNVYNEVDEIIERSLVAGNPDIALKFGEDLIATGHLRGIQLMKLFYELDLVWDKFETDDTIEDAVFKMTGASSRKFEEYKNIYKFILKDRPELVDKPIKGLVGILVAAREGEFDEEDWEDLAKAPDIDAMFDVRRRVRGIQTSGSNRLILTWDRDGLVHCRRGDGEKKHCGYLTRADDDADITAAISRILESAGVVKL